MAGIIHKIETTLGMGGGQKEGDKRKDEHKPEQHSGCKPEQHGEHKPEQQKGGFMENIKDKIHGGGAGGTCDQDKGEKKKKKDKKDKKKKHEDGHKHGDSSSSDSD